MMQDEETETAPWSESLFRRLELLPYDRYIKDTHVDVSERIGSLKRIGDGGRSWKYKSPIRSWQWASQLHGKFRVASDKKWHL